MIMISRILILITTILLFGRCNGPCYKQAQFILPIQITPIKEIYEVNDTIWVELISPYTLIDQISGESVQVGTYPFETGMNVIEILDTSWVNGTSKMEFIQNIGTLYFAGISFPEVVPFFLNDDEKEINHWKFGIVPKVSKGNFVLIFQKFKMTDQKF